VEYAQGELLDKYSYGAEPPGEQYVKDLESFKGTPSEQKATDRAPYFDRNIRLVELQKHQRFEIEKSWLCLRLRTNLRIIRKPRQYMCGRTHTVKRGIDQLVIIK
jgi:hypothetical protein